MVLPSKDAKCPQCGADMWDNRFNKKNPKGPDFNCTNKECKFQLKKGCQVAYENKKFLIDGEWETSQFVTGLWLTKHPSKDEQFSAGMDKDSQVEGMREMNAKNNAAMVVGNNPIFNNPNLISGQLTNLARLFYQMKLTGAIKKDEEITVEDVERDFNK